MILTHRAGIFGFTTAASVWLVAALGIGIGEYEVTLVACALVLAVLWLALMNEHDLRVTRSAMSKSDAGIQYVWQALGRTDAHDAGRLALLENPDVKEFHVVLLDELS